MKSKAEGAQMVKKSLTFPDDVVEMLAGIIRRRYPGRAKMESFAIEQLIREEWQRMLDEEERRRKKESGDPPHN